MDGNMTQVYDANIQKERRKNLTAKGSTVKETAATEQIIPSKILK